MLAAQELSISRGGKRVVDRASATLEPGTITAICGPNGAGKSSLLLGLAGLLPAESGAVSLNDADLAAMPPEVRAKALGYLPQSADVAWDVAVESLVVLGRLPHRDARQEPVEAALQALSLNELRHRPVSRLSGGERARALLARVLAGEPRWILADEPLAALDLAHQLNLIAHFKSCAKAGQGVVIVLHDLALAMNHADRVLVMQEGQVIADGPPEAALSAENITHAWGVDTGWIGEKGAQALVHR